VAGGTAGSIAARPIVSRLAPASSGSLLVSLVAVVFLDRTGTKFRGASATDVIAIGTAGTSAGGFAKIPAHSAPAPNAAPSASEDQARRDQRSASSILRNVGRGTINDTPPSRALRSSRAVGLRETPALGCRSLSCLELPASECRNPLSLVRADTMNEAFHQHARDKLWRSDHTRGSSPRNSTVTDGSEPIVH
jgi:hypothetical protein